MTTHKNALFAAALLLAASAASADPNAIGKRIREVPDAPVEVEIWTDRGDGARYCAGDSIEIYFRTNVDAFIAIYNVDTRGQIHKMFPTRYNRDNFVRGGEINRLPSRYGYHFEVEGPSGWETLRAVAATNPRDLRRFDLTRPASYPTVRPFERIVVPSRNTVIRTNRKLEKIREVPDDSFVAMAEARHFVRDGYRCRTYAPRPWWDRRR